VNEIARERPRAVLRVLRLIFVIGLIAAAIGGAIIVPWLGGK